MASGKITSKEERTAAKEQDDQESRRRILGEKIKGGMKEI